MGSQIQASTFRASDVYIQQKYGMDRTGSSDVAAKLFAMMQDCESQTAAVVLDSGDYLVNPHNWPGAYTGGSGAHFSNLVIRGNGKVRIILDTTTSGTPGSDAPVSDCRSTASGRAQVFCSIAKGTSFDMEGIELEGWNQTIAMEAYTVSDGNSTYTSDKIRIANCKFYKCRCAFDSTLHYTSLTDLDVDKIKLISIVDNEFVDMWQFAVIAMGHRIDRFAFTGNTIIGVGNGCVASVPSTISSVDHSIYGMRVDGGHLAANEFSAITNMEYNRYGVIRTITDNRITSVNKTHSSTSLGDCNAISATGWGINIANNYIDDNTNTTSSDTKPANCESIYTKGSGQIVNNYIRNGGGEAAIQLKGVYRPIGTGTPRWGDAATIQATGTDYDAYAGPMLVSGNRIYATDGQDRLRNGINCIVVPQYDTGSGNRIAPNDCGIRIVDNVTRGVAIGVGVQNQLKGMVIANNDCKDGRTPHDTGKYGNVASTAWYQRGSTYTAMGYNLVLGPNLTFRGNVGAGYGQLPCGLRIADTKEKMFSEIMDGNSFEGEYYPAWVASASYTIKDKVTYVVSGNAKTFQAKTTHSGVGTAPNSDTTNWNDLGFNAGFGIVVESGCTDVVQGVSIDGNKFNNYPKHVTTGTYAVGDIVRSTTAGRLYYCIQAHTTTSDSIPITNTSYWKDSGRFSGMPYAVYFYATTAPWEGSVSSNQSVGCTYSLPNPDNFRKDFNRHLAAYNAESISSTANSAGVITFV